MNDRWMIDEWLMNDWYMIYIWLMNVWWMIYEYWLMIDEWFSYIPLFFKGKNTLLYLKNAWHGLVSNICDDMSMVGKKNKYQVKRYKESNCTRMRYK